MLSALLPPLLLCALLGAPSFGAQDTSPASATSPSDPSSDPAFDETTLRMPWIWGDGMVLPCGRSLPISGRARPFAEVTVDFGPQRSTVQADAEGRWRVRFMGLGESSVGEVLTVEAVPDLRRDPDAVKEILRFEDVVVGEVWLCAGQSNMAFPVRSAVGGEALARDLAAEPELRLLDPRAAFDLDARPWSMGRLRALHPGRAFLPTVWSADSLAMAEGFSAVAGAFGRAVHRELRMPLGLIEVSVGGSPTEAWVPRAEVLADSWLARLETQFPQSVLAHPFVRERAAQHLQAWSDAGHPAPVPEHPFRPGFLFEAAIASLEDFPIAGILWYQGESNADDAPVHDMLFRRAVQAWRRSLRNPGLPVLTVQLPGMGRASWPEFREGQQRLAEMDGVEMAVSLDLGAQDDVHPRDKVPVGERLARIALRRYGRPVPDSGPSLRSHQRRGSQLELRLRHAEGLQLRPGEPSSFWLAGADRRFARATARVVDRGVLLSSELVPDPIAARYAWEPFPVASLFNGAGLPAAPLRTDDWAPIRVHCFSGRMSNPPDLPESKQLSCVLDQQLGPLFLVQGSSLQSAWAAGSVARQGLLDRPVDVVVLAPGLEDVLGLAEQEGPSEAERFVTRTRQLLEFCRGLRTRPTVLLASSLPTAFPGHAQHGDPRLERAQQALDLLAREAGVSVVDPYADLRAEHCPDGLHPNAEGMQLIARRLVQALRSAGLPIALEASPSER